MILLVLNQELGSLVVAACDAHIILLVRVVIVSESPVDESEVPLLMVDHNVQWLDVAVHDAM
jgi:hypothetical protein